MSAIAGLLCRLQGHRWEFSGMVYRQGETWAVVDGERLRVPVAWVNDETCSRCGCESWWPA